MTSEKKTMMGVATILGTQTLGHLPKTRHRRTHSYGTTPIGKPSVLRLVDKNGCLKSRAQPIFCS